jgi:hypothetical protein
MADEPKKQKSWDDLTAKEKGQGIGALMTLPLFLWCVWWGPCSKSDPKPEQAPQAAQARGIPAPPVPPPQAAPPERPLTRAEFEAQGRAWPLTVDEGRIGCERVGKTSGGSTLSTAYFIAPDGTRYALNGLAQSRGLPKVDPIWLPDPHIEGAKINVGPLIQEALKGCE